MSSKIKFRIFDSMSKLKSLFKIKNENRERQQELVLRGGFHSRRALSVGNQIPITRIYYMKYMVEERKLHFFDAEELASITCREEDCRRRHHEDGRIIVEEIKARFNDSTSTSFSSTRGEFMTRVSVLFSVEMILAPLTCIISITGLKYEQTVACE